MSFPFLKGLKIWSCWCDVPELHLVSLYVRRNLVKYLQNAQHTLPISELSESPKLIQNSPVKKA